MFLYLGFVNEYLNIHISDTGNDIYHLNLSFVMIFVVEAIFYVGVCESLFLLDALLGYNQDCSYSLQMVIMRIIKQLTEP